MHKQQILPIFNMHLLINKCITAIILSNFSRHYLRNRFNFFIKSKRTLGRLLTSRQNAASAVC
jgi:hypothetical protein